ncbi:MAG: ZIP family metal transporter [Candidatus Staskawiczbacteria bacterium]|nr:ZIP family metal transporter [Candidatus Staskawiczbacteria bacterium]
MPIAIFLSIAAFLATILGGYFALKFKDKLHYIMALAAGVLLGIVAFDIFPEIIEQVKIYNFDTTAIMVALVFGFLIFHILEKSILIQHCHEADCSLHHKHPHIGVASASALIGHIFLDGVSIGLAFQISNSIGMLVAMAVISHDFTDGMNIVALMISNKNSVKKSALFLVLGAVAPVLGAASTLLFQIPPYFLTLYLGFFAGFLLYIGASDILPEAHSEKSSYKLIGLTILGTLFIFSITNLI